MNRRTAIKTTISLGGALVVEPLACLKPVPPTLEWTETLLKDKGDGWVVVEKRIEHYSDGSTKTRVLPGSIREKCDPVPDGWILIEDRK